MARRNNDKQVYFERSWTRCEMRAQTGTVVEAMLPDGTLVEVPFQHIRDVSPRCKDCDRHIWHSSYQAHSGDSYCKPCYEEMAVGDIELLFSGYQWISWDGQMAVRDMDDSHLINTLGMLKNNATRAAELAGGSPQEFLSPHFPHLVAELKRRRPDDLQTVKMNSMLLYIWTVIMMILTRSSAAKEEKAVVKKVTKKKKKTKKRRQRSSTRLADLPSVPLQEEEDRRSMEIPY